MHNPSLSAAQTGGIRAIISSCLGEVHTYRTWKYPHDFSTDHILFLSAEDSKWPQKKRDRQMLKLHSCLSLRVIPTGFKPVTF